MKHLILGTALSLATAFPVLAQRGDAGTSYGDGGVAEAPAQRGGRAHHRRGRNPEARLEHMTEELNLSPAQVEQLRQLFAERHAQRDQRREQARADRHAHHEAMRARVDAILTPAQRERAQQLRTQHRQEAFDRRLQHMTERLSLRPNQVTQIRRILEQERQQHETIGRGPEHRDAHRALRERTKTQVDAVLDATQRAQAEELRERRGRHGRHGEGREHRGERRGQGRGPQKA